MCHSLWLLTAACLASGVDQLSPTEDATAPPKSMPAVLAAQLACPDSFPPCPRKRCSMLERLHRRWQQVCGHADCAPEAALVPPPAKPSDCVKPCETVGSSLSPAPCQCCTCSSGCTCPCSNAGVPSRAAVAPCAGGEPCTQSWLSLIENAGPPTSQAAAKPGTKLPALLYGNDGMTFSPASAPATAGSRNGGKLRPLSPYSPTPGLSSKPEPVPVVTDVQVSGARAINPETPTRKVDTKDRLFDPPAMKFDPLTQKPDAPARKCDNVIQTAAISLAPAGPDITWTYLNRAGCAADYSRLTGQLSYVHTGGGLWVVRYAPLDGEDRYGGSVVLAPVVSMDRYKDGDLVSVTGEVLNDGQRASKFLGGPLYRATSVTLVDRLTKGAE